MGVNETFKVKEWCFLESKTDRYSENKFWIEILQGSESQLPTAWLAKHNLTTAWQIHLNQSGFTWENIEEMINLIFINHTNLCRANWAADLFECFVISRRGFPCIKSFGPSISFSWSWNILHQNLDILNLAVYNKYSPILGQIFFMPARN